MNTQGADGTLAGGGEILQFWGNNGAYDKEAPFLDNQLINQFNILPVVKFAIVILIFALMTVAILKIFNIRSPFRGKGITRELERMDKIKQRDLSILKANRVMAWVTNFIQHTPFSMNTRNKDYWQYNINRAGIRIPGGSRLMKAEELNSIITFIAGCGIIVSLIITLIVNSFLGMVLIVSIIIVANTVPLMIIRSTVREKDLEIKENFADYYLMIHYVLLASAKTPLSGIMKSYAKTTSSKEMIRYIDACIHYIDTYGEYEATKYITKDYRELPEVGKLMRLIKQANEGGEIEAELFGFRTELLAAKRYAIEKRMDKLIKKAQASFNILMPVLFQAILSAMAIYVSDLGVASTIVGGLA